MRKVPRLAPGRKPEREQHRRQRRPRASGGPGVRPGGARTPAPGRAPGVASAGIFQSTNTVCRSPAGTWKGAASRSMEVAAVAGVVVFSTLTIAGSRRTTRAAHQKPQYPIWSGAQAPHMGHRAMQPHA